MSEILDFQACSKTIFIVFDNTWDIKSHNVAFRKLKATKVKFSLLKKKKLDENLGAGIFLKPKNLIKQTLEVDLWTQN